MTTAAFRASLGIVIVLSIWLGAVLYFIAVVAPAAFRVLPTRTLAGALVGETLPTIFFTGTAAGVLVVIFLIAGGPAVPRRVLRMVGGALVAVLCVVAQVVIGGRIDRLRTTIGTSLDALPAGDPTRAAFGRMHALSVASLGLAALVALALLVGAAVSLYLHAAAQD
jgi:hypothetical protein